MIRIHCRNRHHPGTGAPCTECFSLEDYALERLRRCPFKNAKPACKDCTIHCYQPGMRARAQQVMRHAGPRMLLRHPWLALCHLLVRH